LISLALAALALKGGIVPARAASLALLPPVVGMAQLFAPDRITGFAMKGFDPVSYFLDEGLKPGLPEYEVIWNGLAWRFASAANREAFARDPEAYAPQFGGYDPTALAGGIAVPGNPLFAAVRSDRLYLFRNDHDRARFMADESIVARAEGYWPEVIGELAQP
jgi:hypothetical protein